MNPAGNSNLTNYPERNHWRSDDVSHVNPCLTWCIKEKYPWTTIARVLWSVATPRSSGYVEGAGRLHGDSCLFKKILL